MSHDFVLAVAHVGGIIFVLTILVSMLFVLFLVVNDEIRKLRTKRADARILEAAEEARSDFE